MPFSVRSSLFEMMLMKTVRPMAPGAAVRGVVRGFAFWAAIMLAFSYPAILFGIDRGYIGASALIAVIVIHCLALFLGRKYQ